jgi:LPXTG-motif cell wall-anchored protein
LGAPASTGNDKGNKGSVILGLAITTIALLIIVTLIVMRRSLSGKDEEFTIDSQPADANVVDSSEPIPSEVEDDMTRDGPDNDLKTVEIL